MAECGRDSGCGVGNDGDFVAAFFVWRAETRRAAMQFSLRRMLVAMDGEGRSLENVIVEGEM